jgi:hypothetical protein
VLNIKFTRIGNKNDRYTSLPSLSFSAYIPNKKTAATVKPLPPFISGLD